MSIDKFRVAVLVLWAISIVVFLVFFIGGNGNKYQISSGGAGSAYVVDTVTGHVDHYIYGKKR